MNSYFIEMYVVLGAAAGVFFLVAAARAFSLRRYADLFDEAARRGSCVGGVCGRYSGRAAEIALVPSDHISSTPAKLRISIECAAPLEVEAVRESMATALRKAIGVQPDRKTGLEDLDRLFAFQFYDRRKVEGCFGRIEVREGFLSLAELGADSVRIRDSLLRVDLPMRFVVPPGVGRMRRVLESMSTLGSAMESALSTGGSASPSVAPRGDVAADSIAGASRHAASAIAAPVFYAVFFVAMIAAFLIVGPFWDFNGKIPWRTRLGIVHARLPMAALLTGSSGFLAALLVPRKPALWGLQLGWPLILHAALAWILFLVARGSGIPGIAQELASQGEFVRGVLTAASTAAALVFGSGLLGALVATRVSGTRLDESPRAGPSSVDAT